MNKIQIKCPDGFANQLRLSLAANLLAQKNKIESAEQEWIVNNHNIVHFNKFFINLPKLKFTNISADDPIVTRSFTDFIKYYYKECNIIKTFQESFACLNLKIEYKELINYYISKLDIKNCIGLHLRTGCKTALLSSSPDRNQPIPQVNIVELLKKSNKKIFLSTDNAETQDKFLKMFADRVIYFEKITAGKEDFGCYYDRDLVKRYTSDLHVIVDFYLLQNCEYFIGSNESSLSLMIKYIRNNKNDYRIQGVL